MPRDLFALPQEAPVEQQGPRDLLALPQSSPGVAIQPEYKSEPYNPSLGEKLSNYGESFVERAKDLGKGLYLGALETAGGLYQKLGNTGALNVLSPVGAAQWEQGGKEALSAAHEGAKSAYDDTTGITSTVGRVAGNVLGTAPLGPAMGAAGRLAGAGTSVLGRLGLSAAGGAAQGALAGGTLYSENQDSKFNTGAALVGGALGGIANPIISALPIVRSRLRNDEVAGNAYNKIVDSLSQKIGRAGTLDDAEQIASRGVKLIAGKIKNNEKKAWNTVFSNLKDKPVVSDNLANLKNTAKAFVKDNADELPSSMKSWVNKHILNEKDVTFDKMKQLRSLFRDHKENLWKKVGSGDITRSAAKASNEVYDGITDVLRETARVNGKLPEFITANEISKNVNIFKNEVGADLAKIAKERAVAGNFITSLFNKKSGDVANTIATKMPKGMADTAEAYALKRLAIESTDAGGSFNVRRFFTALKNKPQYSGMLRGTEQGKALQGLYNVIDDAGAKGSIDLGGIANMSAIAKVGNNVLRFLTGGRGNALKKDLVRYGLIEKNEQMKQYLGNKIMSRFQRVGIRPIADTLHLLDNKSPNNPPNENKEASSSSNSY